MSDTPRVMRQYTSAFKVPVYIGKLNGFAMPGGPYTLRQLLGSILAFLAAMITRPAWGQGGPLDYVVAAGISIPIGILVGRIKTGPRNPLQMGLSVLGGLRAPRFGTRGGRAVEWPTGRWGAPRRSVYRVWIDPDPGPVSPGPVMDLVEQVVPEPRGEGAGGSDIAGLEPACEVPVAASAARGLVPVTAMERLLALSVQERT